MPRARPRVVVHWLMPVSARVDARSSPSTVSPAIDALAEQHLRRGAGGQIDVDPAAEADQADALAGLDRVAFA